MLGRPSTDPHGDPIPDSEGAVATHEYQTLLTCPVDTAGVLTRVTDQDSQFLRFLEDSDLTPGQSIRVKARDTAVSQSSVQENPRAMYEFRSPPRRPGRRSQSLRPAKATEQREE